MCQVKLCPCMVLFFNEVEDYIKYLAISQYFVGCFIAWYDMVSGSRIFSQIAENVASNI